MSFSRRLALILCVMGLAGSILHGQFAVLGRNIPRGASGQITSSDITFKGYYIAGLFDGTQGDFSYAKGGFAMSKVGDVNHFFIAQAGAEGCAGAGAPCDGSPVEFTDPGTWDTNGNCTSAANTCPRATFGAGGSLYTSLTYVKNWGLNDDGSFADFFHGKNFQFWADDGTNTLDTTTCADHNLCYNWFSTITPAGDYLVSYNKYYGQNAPYAGAVLVRMNADVSGFRSTNAYGPLVFATRPGGTYDQTGTWAAMYFTTMPDGTMGFGAGYQGATQQGFAPAGPTLETMATWPTPATSTAYNARLTATKTFMRYYRLDRVMNADGTLFSGQPNIGYRYPFLWPYVYEGPGAYGDYSAIDPAQYAGVGTWNEEDRATGVLAIKTATKQGAIAFLSTATNHLVNNPTTACTYSGMTVAHNWYCNGVINTYGRGTYCADPDGAGPLIGDGKSPHYACDAAFQNTGPVPTTIEGQWPIFNWDTMAQVAAGSKVDYTQDPSGVIFPQTQFGLVLSDATERYEGGFAVPGTYDYRTNNFYVMIPKIFGNGYGTLPVIAVFHVAQ